ncbi:MAG: SUMF1/EgtB/PvdO family nonheme iron enzyme [Elusimicrobiota bacterium]|nr:SUMF1/EgtB/PvdO family nonheme iron enzyme [Elusimicrobiota bacterium]
MRNCCGESAVVKVFAIKMVKVPQGSFIYNVGNIGGTGWNNIAGPKTVDSALTDDLPGGAAAGWPNGYNSFYIMKYEISQGQYADFLNSIKDSTATANFHNDYNGSNGNDINYAAGFNYGERFTAVNANRAMNYLSTHDAWGYLSWAGLRPMTEMEYEKASRDLAADARVYPWGDYAPADDTTTNIYTPANEGGTHKKYYLNFRNVPGGAKVMDVGRYMSGDIYRTQEQTGASPWGIADLLGNVWEHSVNSSYLSVPENGTGTENWPNWPVVSSTEKGIRGGSWSDGLTRGRVSVRYSASWTYTTRHSHVGARRGHLKPCSFYAFTSAVRCANCRIKESVPHGTFP